MDFATLFDRLRAHPAVRRLAWLGFLSLVAALTLTGYVFGLKEGFFGKWLSATVVFWLLSGGTAFGILPATRWLTGPLVDRVQAQRQRRAKSHPAPPRRQTPPTRSTRRPAADKWQ